MAGFSVEYKSLTTATSNYVLGLPRWLFFHESVPVLNGLYQRSQNTMFYAVLAGLYLADGARYEFRYSSKLRLGRLSVLARHSLHSFPKTQLARYLQFVEKIATCPLQLHNKFFLGTPMDIELKQKQKSVKIKQIMFLKFSS